MYIVIQKRTDFVFFYKPLTSGATVVVVPMNKFFFL